MSMPRQITGQLWATIMGRPGGERNKKGKKEEEHKIWSTIGARQALPPPPQTIFEGIRLVEAGARLSIRVWCKGGFAEPFGLGERSNGRDVSWLRPPGVIGEHLLVKGLWLQNRRKSDSATKTGRAGWARRG